MIALLETFYLLSMLPLHPGNKVYPRLVTYKHFYAYVVGLHHVCSFHCCLSCACCKSFGSFQTSPGLIQQIPIGLDACSRDLAF
jgi:hypothetical protein